MRFGNRGIDVSEILIDPHWTTELLIIEKRLPWYYRHAVSLPVKAIIMEEFFANELSIGEISKKYRVDYRKVCDIVSLYWKKPEHGLSIMSKI